MGYRIQYGQTMTKEEIKEPVDTKRMKPLLAIILLICIVFFFIFLGGTETLRDCFIPGDPEITEAAVKMFIEDVREGESIGDAITAFCLEIIDNADVSE